MQKLNSGALNRILLFVYILSLSTNAIAQNKNNSKETYLLPPHGNYVYGRVIEKLSKEPMVGVTIRLDGHSTGVITDINGCYVLTLPEKGGLVIYSYIGFETRKIKVTSRQKVDVQMVEATESIQEVIVTGYNSIQKESFTGNTTKIEKEDLLKVNPNNLISAIQTFDPSFRIQENLAAGSDPNSLPQFVLRGQTGIGETTLGQTSTSSISREVLSGNSNLPIFILDGFEVDVEKIYDLDMNSIHSINILKDAAATAMYGSRAANGVIVIERRAPEAGKFRVQYSGVLSAELPDLSSYNLMNAREKLETERLAGLYDSNTPEIDPYTNGYYQRLNNVLTGVDTYWLSQGLRTALNHKHSVFIDGGENDVRWGVELGFRGTEGVMKHSSRKNANAAFYVDYRIGGLQIKNKVTYTYNKSTDVPFNSFSDYSHLLPYMRLYDENGDYVRRLEKFDGASGTQVNPLYEINFYNSFDHSGYDEVTDDLSLNWRITDGLRLRGQFSVLMRNSTGDLYKDPASASYSASTGNINGEKTESTQKRTVIDGSLSLMYNNTFKGHNLNICLSSNMRQTQSTASETRYRGFPGGDLVSSNYAAEVYGKPSSSDNTTRLVGALLTSNYTYNNIYLADLTGRIDGSSEFGSDKRWSMFWSTGAGINIHNYDFMKSNELFSMLKFRASYGLTGKTNFSLYSAKDMYQLQTDSWYPTGYGVFLYQMGNPNLKWERKYTLDYGVEIGLWHDKIYLKASAYDERTIDLITDYTIPSSTGFTSYKENMGKVKNTGVELELRARLYSDRNWLFQLYGSFARNKNTIVEISQAMRDYNKRVEELFSGYNPESSSDSKYAKTYLKYYEGASLTSIYGMKSLGISPTNGKEIYLRRNGDVTDVWSADEWTIIGDTAPKGQGSFGYTLSYKQLSMFASFLYTFGGDAYNNTLVSYVENADIKNDNVDKRVLLDRWQKPGDITTMKDIRDRNVTTGASSRFVQKNNTLQWSSLTMSYNFRPEQLKKLHLSGLRLSFTMNDLFYWSTIRQERGLDYPYSRSFNLTTNIIF
ncbi:Outer membrane TonB-dependent transporter, utilization system for glycans and polysaccharides (PUL), SusC family [Bacteroides ovatus]|uniref:SusC/RagA family TonB-linked outer membrane protein n=1 Tax=Bacteroides TaxID=816 RepID=UPI0001BC7E91|nr:MULTISPECIES: SusC/RagA family TonB-linked outer membrane protein [Bacteroides]EFS32608.1 SusC/RagA family TonB-linked outer membrane protein [Bacteroides sp. D2]MCS3179241.1 SusC/RagA family TonB-linked outer membrane protein [Candidatus Bacteroides intestinigallinarum]RGN65204.1 SusC/RagA family TonB-linked outer membrane protein [Bacteroides sp. OM05-10AA]RGQ69431.1 SusC/RagA family TonB-linked outer membrane protein [Bacteroides sp. AF27-33]UWN99325.1 SusC/RagA family TonB-linked outer 